MFIVIDMKKITNSKIQTALLRGAVLLSGSMLTGITALFIDDFYGVITLLVIGAGIVCILDEQIKTNLKNKVK
jgi:hypothetical protein